MDCGILENEWRDDAPYLSTAKSTHVSQLACDKKIVIGEFTYRNDGGAAAAAEEVEVLVGRERMELQSYGGTSFFGQLYQPHPLPFHGDEMAQSCLSSSRT